MSNASKNSVEGSCLVKEKHSLDADGKCPWHINSKEHNNCLWTYIKANSGPDGSMPELVRSEIARLLGYSNTKTHFMIKQATDELTVALQLNKANQLLNENNPESLANMSIPDPKPIYGIDDKEE